MPRLDHLLSFASGIKRNDIRPVDMDEEIILRPSCFGRMVVRVVMIMRMRFVVAGAAVVVIVRHYSRVNGMCASERVWIMLGWGPYEKRGLVREEGRSATECGATGSSQCRTLPQSWERCRAISFRIFVALFLVSLHAVLIPFEADRRVISVYNTNGSTYAVRRVLSYHWR